MRPSRHFAVSTAAGGVLWAASGEPWILPITVAAGVVVDADHAPDLWWNFALRHQPVFTVVVHAWKWLAGLVVLGVWMGFPWWIIGVVVGYGLHLTTDHLFNSSCLWTYSLFFRTYRRFQVAQLAPGWDFDHAYDVIQRKCPLAAKLIELWRARAPR